MRVIILMVNVVTLSFLTETGTTIGADRLGEGRAAPRGLLLVVDGQGAADALLKRNERLGGCDTLDVLNAVVDQ